MKKFKDVLFVALALGCFFPFAKAEEREWTNKAGRAIKAEFVSADDQAVTLSMRGKTYVVKLADLSPQSRALAAKLSVQKSTVQENEAQDEAGLSSPAPPV